jgi:energy-coupling factor transporter ATP-binding protein EcfA2
LPDEILEVSGLWFWYDDENTPALRGLDLVVQRGEFLALVGANGSGKTTLTKHFNGLLRPRRGHVRVNGQDTAGRSVGELARHVGYLFQNPEQQIFSPSVRQELAFGPQNLGLSSAEVEVQVEDALERFRLADVVSSPPAVLSYGLRRRVTLASLAAMDPPVLVLDEPTVGLDAPGLVETFDWLAELHAKGRTIVLVTHEMSLAAEHATRVVAMRAGQIVASAPPAELFQQHELLTQTSLTAPPVLALARALMPFGMRGDSLTVESFCDEYIALIEERPQSQPDPSTGAPAESR